MKRTIAAILAADVAGYSRLIAEDEEDTLDRLAEYSALYRAEVAAAEGRVFNTAGDAILAEFPSAVEALRAAVAIQERLRALNAAHPPQRRLQFRMGLTIGDVVERDNGDMLGDGVNIAARLEGIAEPGGICLSGAAHEAIANRVAVTFRDIGRQRLKNIPRPVQAYRVVLPSDRDRPAVPGWRRWRTRRAGLAAGAAALALAVALGAAAALRLGPFAGAEEGTAEAQGAERADLMPVSLARPRRLCFLDRVRLAGTLVPRQEVEAGADAEGLRVLRVLAAPGARVAAGQSLAELARPEAPAVVAAAIRAPVSGTLTRVAARPGDRTVLRGPSPFGIAAQGDFDLAAEAPAAALARLAPGQAVAVQPLGLPEITGRVRSVSEDLDPGSQLGRARIGLRTNLDLRPGTFARGLVTVAERCGLGVPASAIERGEQGSLVYVGGSGRIEGRAVVTGLAAGDAVEIREGLTETDAVVLRAAPFLREGDRIRPVAVAEER